MQISKEILDLVSIVFDNERNKNQKNLTKQKKGKDESLNSLSKRQKQIEETMLRTTHAKLYEKLE